MIAIEGRVSERKKIRKVPLNVAAGEAGVHPDTIVRWMDAGDLTEYRTAGNHRRVDLDQLKELLESKRREAFDRTATVETVPANRK